MLSFLNKSKVATKSEAFDVQNADAHLLESVSNLKDAKADVSKETTNFCVITDKELIFLLPRCVNKAENAIVGPLFEIASKVIKMISAAGQDNLYDSHTFIATGRGRSELSYQDFAYIRFETSSPKKILETIQNYYKVPAISMSAKA